MITGVVDKSVELLSSKHESLSIQKIFELAEQSEVGEWENQQIDDYEYCRKKESK